MAEPVLFAAFLWWFGTGAIFAATRPKRRGYGLCFALISLLALGAAAAALWSFKTETPMGVYVGFAAAIMLWGWHEFAFLTGTITGPRTLPCPRACNEWTRFWCATATVIHHEIALLATVTALYAAAHGAANPMALHCFLLLWLMRLSAKLNLFLGVPNYVDEMLPAHLSHLRSYFRRGPVNPLFPISATLGAITVAALIWVAAASGTAPITATAAVLLASLAALGLLEHWFMVLPVRDAALWSWFAPTSTRDRPVGATAPPLATLETRSASPKSVTGGVFELNETFRSEMMHDICRIRDMSARRWLYGRRSRAAVREEGTRAYVATKNLLKPAQSLSIRLRNETRS
ncbi:MAG: DUF3623 domain-containing protein [Rhodobacteraceae bacterium]|nr:DUF3623 domain-containing protein [Paracoccaceae bacterium]